MKICLIVLYSAEVKKKKNENMTEYSINSDTK